MTIERLFPRSLTSLIIDMQLSIIELEKSSHIAHWSLKVLIKTTKASALTKDRGQLNSNWYQWWMRHIIRLMPSLYESAKQSVHEYHQIKKQNQSPEEKKVFKWKLVALGLSIVLIVLIGVFSELLSSINELPPDQVDQSYALPLVQQVAESGVISNTGQAGHLIQGIGKAMVSQGYNFEWNRATLLYEFQGPAFTLEDFTNSINRQGQLVYVFTATDDDKTVTNRFGMFLYAPFDGVRVVDDSSTRYSTFFNLNSGEVMGFDHSGCSLYRQTNVLTLAQSVSLGNSQGTIIVGFLQEEQTSCFGADRTAAEDMLSRLVGMQISSTMALNLNSLQVYQLSLEEDA